MQKIIDIDTCIQMLSIVMTNQAHLQPFIEFLQHQTEYKFINNDQWMGFNRFSLEVSCGFTLTAWFGTWQQVLVDFASRLRGSFQCVLCN